MNYVPKTSSKGHHRDDPLWHKKVVESGMFSAAEFRKTVGNFATGVTVITTRDTRGSPRGLTANAFASLSLNPPLVVVCVDRGSDTYPALQSVGAVFVVNILAEHQQELSQKFASKGGSGKFEGVEWHEERTGAPILEDILAFMECKVAERFDGGDHGMVVGEVENLGVNEGREPLLFYRGRYGFFRN